MPEQSIRFGISDGTGRRSATWKCWSSLGVGKSDIYLTCRELGGALKASLHQSGNWHFAFSKEFFNNQFVDPTQVEKGRFIDKWRKPAEVSPGIIKAFCIITPNSAVKRIFDERSFDRVHWIPIANVGKATEIDILITNDDNLISNWLNKNTEDTKYIGSMNLQSGETVLAIYKEIDLPSIHIPKTKIQPKFFKDRNKEDFKSKDLYMILFCKMPDGTMALVDSMVFFEEENKDI